MVHSNQHHHWVAEAVPPHELVEEHFPYPETRQQCNRVLVQRRMLSLDGLPQRSHEEQSYSGVSLHAPCDAVRTGRRTHPAAPGRRDRSSSALASHSYAFRPPQTGKTASNKVILPFLALIPALLGSD